VAEQGMAGFYWGNLRGMFAAVPDRWRADVK
jgi:hypothetical protein